MNTANKNSVVIPVYQPSIGSLEKDLVNQCLDTGWISSKGEFVSRFEKEFASYIGLEYCVSVSNGTTALHAALLAVGIGEGDEVIVPSLTYVAAANAITYTGAQAVFVDCLTTTWQMNIDDVRRVISSRTKAILAVHLYGLPCDLDALKRVCDEFGLLLIEDCAEAIGTRYMGRHVGCFGDVSCFSFFGNKTITTGEGGMIATSSPSIAERAFHIKGQGLARHREYWHDIVGYNYRMTNICAAIGCAQLQRVGGFLERKRQIALMYRLMLESRFEFQLENEGCLHSHWMVACLAPSAKLRDPIRAVLAASGVETRPVFYPVHSMPMYSRNYRRLPVSEMISSRGINLPSYPDLSDEQVRGICQLIHGAL